MTEAMALEGISLVGMTTNDLVKEAVDIRRQRVQLNKRIAEVDRKLAESVRVDVIAALEREFWPGVCKSASAEIRGKIVIVWASLNVYCGEAVYYGQVDFLDSWKKYFSGFELCEISLEVFEKLLAGKFPRWELELNHGGMLITGKPWKRHDKFAMSMNVENLLAKSAAGGQDSGEVPVEEDGVVSDVKVSVEATLVNA